MPKTQISMIFRQHCYANSMGVSMLWYNLGRTRNTNNSKNLAPKAHLKMGQKWPRVTFFNRSSPSVP